MTHKQALTVHLDRVRWSRDEDQISPFLLYTCLMNEAVYRVSLLPVKWVGLIRFLIVARSDQFCLC